MHLSLWHPIQGSNKLTSWSQTQENANEGKTMEILDELNKPKFYSKLSLWRSTNSCQVNVLVSAVTAESRLYYYE